MVERVLPGGIRTRSDPACGKAATMFREAPDTGWGMAPYGCATFWSTTDEKGAR
jgi:hypothetical protein